MPTVELVESFRAPIYDGNWLDPSSALQHYIGLWEFLRRLIFVFADYYQPLATTLSRGGSTSLPEDEDEDEEQ
ncbi:unnamed protein product [Acanthocheilonema viteae]|uniref:Uncharacterized protein n=1 Tax=Acanthocheilonema viteae TaxID=6277 RepID=A0A498SAN4_ACAVI|nr:unnamed protein product [Acanthocheilonema viteae]